MAEGSDWLKLRDLTNQVGNSFDCDHVAGFKRPGVPCSTARAGGWEVGGGGGGGGGGGQDDDITFFYSGYTSAKSLVDEIARVISVQLGSGQDCF